MSDYGVLLQQVINGLSLGAMYALLALGFNLVYGILELINFAHFNVFMVASFVGMWALQLLGISGQGQVLTGMALAGALFFAFAATMVAAGVLGVAIYTMLKRVFVRERPFITHDGIDRAGATLDRYSFPSGHTLHAVSFAWQASAHFPELAWVLLPLAGLIAASRVVLGLHYPSDVLAGAAIGAALAELGLSCA